ncbi:helicase C-terminal domain-containing protein [Undibacterium umbellatum]|uniref:ATP-dependent DNA helicase n=1 Tax=Undibacterium umbellatum TaxID=2762300 RepID=A0ABR6ZHZ9_9BURK|nr:ATP-dependent DNA helicase [Undibacterium umbellatum]MBC3911347.1 ATP-dependent DNA helicase [Undibacterium umbellatum]
MSSNSTASYTVAVRALCEFTAKQGDLDLRFTPSPTAEQGMAGHATVALRRSGNYQREVKLEGQHGSLQVRGRADGYDPDLQQVEEIKTFLGDLHAMPDNHRHLHWAQAKVYGHLLCQKLGLQKISVALVYFNIQSQKETVLQQELLAAELADFFVLLCSRFIAWAEQEVAHRAARDLALGDMVFPHAAFRPGQRQLAEAMYKASKRGCCLLAQAPTGIGKTIGSLFPLLKATAEHKLDKVFYLAAKTSGRQLALHALGNIQNSTPNLGLRTLELVAKTKACEYPEAACHGDACPLAKGFYDRLPAARAAAVEQQLLDKEGLRSVALAHQVCPYYLGIEMARWADVIIGDYNYYFDLYALLHGLTIVNNWRVAVLVDEAHNMVTRARQMYSAELQRDSLKRLRKTPPPALKKPLNNLYRAWLQLEKEQEADYQAHAETPEKLLTALTRLCTEIGLYFADNPSQLAPDLQQFYLDALLFNRLAESFADHSIFDISKEHGASTLCIRNIVPAAFLTPRFAASHTTALFSATLSPWNYYCDTLGLPDGTAWVDVESPFSADQLQVHVVDSVSTRYADRARSVAPIVALMAQQYQAQPGNYLAFFSSFDYLEQVSSSFINQHPDIPVRLQTRRMNEADREEFLAQFTEDSQGIAFAVLGGSFGEGIDLPGARLIGAFIATLGLPQLNPINEQIKLRMDKIFGAGYDYAYLYPGLQKVVQAAGRVIRQTDDKGVVYLIDDRFARGDVRALLPGWWAVR